MKISSAFPSKYLKAADLPEGRDVHVKIDAVQMEVMEQTGDEKPVMYFDSKEKGLVLNVTNANTISDKYGDDTDGWGGRPLILFATTTSFGGRTVPCIRVKVPAGGPHAAPQPAEQPLPSVSTQLATNEQPTDDIPF